MNFSSRKGLTLVFLFLCASFVLYSRGRPLILWIGYRKRVTIPALPQSVPLNFFARSRHLLLHHLARARSCHPPLPYTLPVFRPDSLCKRERIFARGGSNAIRVTNLA